MVGSVFPIESKRPCDKPQTWYALARSVSIKRLLHENEFKLIKSKICYVSKEVSKVSNN